MLIEGNSDIIKRCEFNSESATQWLTFRNDFVLVLAPSFIALYKDQQSIGDPLGNGLKAMEDLSVELAQTESGFVAQYQAGFVGLVDGKAILITPNDIQLFADKTDALHNRNELARLMLA